MKLHQAERTERAARPVDMQDKQGAGLRLQAVWIEDAITFMTHIHSESQDQRETALRSPTGIVT